MKPYTACSSADTNTVQPKNEVFIILADNYFMRNVQFVEKKPSLNRNATGKKIGYPFFHPLNE